MLARISNLEAFRQWREREDQTVKELVHWLTVVGSDYINGLRLRLLEQMRDAAQKEANGNA